MNRSNPSTVVGGGEMNSPLPRWSASRAGVGASVSRSSRSVSAPAWSTGSAARQSRGSWPRQRSRLADGDTEYACGITVHPQGSFSSPVPCSPRFPRRCCRRRACPTRCCRTVLSGSPDDVVAVEEAEELVPQTMLSSLGRGAPDDVVVRQSPTCAPDDVGAPDDVVAVVSERPPDDVVTVRRPCPRRCCRICTGAPDDIVRPGGLVEVDQSCCRGHGAVPQTIDSDQAR